MITKVVQQPIVKTILITTFLLAVTGCATTKGASSQISDRERQAYKFLEDGMSEVVRGAEEARYTAASELQGDRRHSLVEEIAHFSQEARRVKRGLAAESISAVSLQRELEFLTTEYSRVRDGLTFFRSPPFLVSRWSNVGKLLERVQQDCERTLCFNRGSWHHPGNQNDLSDRVAELRQRLEAFYSAEQEALRGRRAERELRLLIEQSRQLEKDLEYVSYDELEKQVALERLLETGETTVQAFYRAPRSITEQPDWVRSREILRELERSFRRTLAPK